MPTITKRCTKSGARAAASSAISEPMLWPTSVAWLRTPAAANRASNQSADASTESGIGPGLRPWPGRSTASTLLNESGKWSADAIERALAHGDADAVRAAYHRGAHWQERVQMAQWWSDYLDQLREGGKVVPLKRNG